MRDTLYPLDRKGSSRFWNRAGDKLMQLVESVELLTSLRSTTFIDVCGGPGAFTQLILRYPNIAIFSFVHSSTLAYDVFI